MMKFLFKVNSLLTLIHRLILPNYCKNARGHFGPSSNQSFFWTNYFVNPVKMINHLRIQIIYVYLLQLQIKHVNQNQN